jgi:hypothetical protein
LVDVQILRVVLNGVGRSFAKVTEAMRDHMGTDELSSRKGANRDRLISREHALRVDRVAEALHSVVRLDGADAQDGGGRHVTTVEKPVANLRSVPPALIDDVAPWCRDAPMEVVDVALEHVVVFK